METLCQTNMQLSLGDVAVKLAVNPDLPPSKKLQGETVVLEADLKRREYHKNWRLRNVEKARKYGTDWYHRNRDKILKGYQLPHQKARRAADAKKRNQDPKHRARRRELYKLSAEKWRAKTRAFNSSPKGKEYARVYQRRRRRENFNVHFMNWLRGSVNRCLRNQGTPKIMRTRQYLGCNPAELIKHLESQFEPGMSWAIPRSWDVDHIIPSSVFDLSDPEEAMIVFNYKNLRPMDRMENKFKSANLPDVFPSWIPAHIANRIKTRMGK